jgi:hypothetical protein
MGRVLSILRYGVPGLIAVGVAAVGIPAGLTGAPLTLGMLAGALLGWAVMLAVDGVLTWAGLLSCPPRLDQRRLQQIERDRLLLVRTVKEIELDAALQKLDPEEADALCAPLRARAERLLGQLDEARQEKPLTVEQQIEREVSRRLEGGR